MNRLVQVMKVYQWTDYDEDSISVAAHWTEVTDEEFEELRQAIKEANSLDYYTRGYKFFLVEKVNKFAQIFAEAKAWKEQVRIDAEKRAKVLEKAKATREAKALEKKKRQLERLKKELESD